MTDHSIYTHEGKFWGKAGAGILLFAAATGRLLLGKRSRFVNEPGTWNLFGGAIESGEDPAEAAAREVSEELGYTKPIAVKPVFVYRSGTFAYHNFIGVVPEEFTPRLNWETEEARWLTVAEAYKLTPKHYGLEALLNHLQGDLMLPNPYPNEHAARIIDPKEIRPDTYRSKQIKAGIRLIIGKRWSKTTARRKADPMVVQAIRFKNSVYTAAQAKAWLKKYKVKVQRFEAATSTQMESRRTEMKKRKRRVRRKLA
jgi:8-oxo-dGTP pyrophosphatase MutT (NUDIX family)